MDGADQRPLAQLMAPDRRHEVPMVSMDGQAHPEITLAAVGLGVLVACLILIALIAVITRCKERGSPPVQPGTVTVSTVSQKLADRDRRLADVITQL